MIDFGYGVQLGTLEKEELPLYRSWRNHYSVWKWCRQNDLISASDHATWFERIHADPAIRMYTIRGKIEQQEGKGYDGPVGVAGFTSIDDINRRAEFSLYIAPTFHGNGFGKRGLKTLIQHGFLNLGLNSIWGESFDGNPAMKIFEDVGFVKEGLRRQFYYRSGKFIDAHLYGLLRKDWEKGLRKE